MTERDPDVQKFIPLCPLCKGYTFREHWMPEFQKEWNKCQSCGYMEPKKTSLERIISKLYPDRLNEPFVEPVTRDMLESAVNIGIYKNKTKKHKKRPS